MGEVMFENRLVKVDSFPMGIDYAKYHEAANSVAVRRERRKVQRTLVLAFDPFDRQAGLFKRNSETILGFELFLSYTSGMERKV
jgi:trehalose 6-phosphate synthase/phosphatase